MPSRNTTLASSKKTLAIILVTLSLLGILSIADSPLGLVKSVSADTLYSSVYVTPIQKCCIQPNDPNPTFSVNVMMNLTQGNSINGFDIKLNYTNWYVPGPPAQGFVKAISLDPLNNIFHKSGFSVYTQASCIDDVTYATDGSTGFCAPDDIVGGEVHFAQTALGSMLTGPVSSALLFTVTFTVNATGTSLFYFERANLGDPGGNPPNPHFIQILTGAGIFGNGPIVAFFDYRPTVSPSVLVGTNAMFDASKSFRAGSSPSPLVNPVYSWNFGDGSWLNNTSNPKTTHSYSAPGNYTVSLMVNDTGSPGGYFQRQVPVGPRLGGLSVTVRNTNGATISSLVYVHLLNYTVPAPPLCSTCNLTATAGGYAIFTGLTPGIYTLQLSGPAVDPGSKTTTVQEGWTTQETVYLTEKTGPAPTDIPLVIFAGVVIGGLALFITGLFFRRRRILRAEKRQTISRKAPSGPRKRQTR